MPEVNPFQRRALPAIAIWDFPISYDTETSRMPRVKIAKFGDGYEQRSPDGINNQPRQVHLRMDHYRSVVQQAANFLDSTNGSIPFWFTPPFSPQGLFVADQGYKVVEKGFDYAVLEATLREVFEYS